MSRGRPSKAGKRYKNGKLVQPTPRERDDVVLEPVMRRRCRERGLPPTEANLKLVRGEKFGFELGIANIDGHITQDEFEAGVAYAIAYTANSRIMGLPSPTPKAASYGLSVAGVDNSEPDPNHVANIKARWKGWEDALKSAGSTPEHVVHKVCIIDAEASPRWLKVGLATLARYQKRVT